MAKNILKAGSAARQETDSAKQLDCYFSALAKTNQKIPFISDVSEKTGISVATISRYARRKGYQSYAELRARQINGTLRDLGDAERVEKFMRFLEKFRKIVVVTSQSSEVIGHFIVARLKSLKFDACLALKGDMPVIKEDTGVLLVTISGESMLVTTFLEKVSAKNTMLITCLRVRSENQRVISLSEFMYEYRTAYTHFKAIREVNEWIQRAVDQYTTVKAAPNNQPLTNGASGNSISNN